LPKPKSFCAWLNRRADLEAFKMLFLRGNFLEEKFVEKVGFTSSVFTTDRHDPNLLRRKLV